MPKPSRFPSIVDIDNLPPEERRKVRPKLLPRNTMHALRFNSFDIADWKEAAKKLGVSDTEFIEETLNTAAANILGRK